MEPGYAIRPIERKDDAAVARVIRSVMTEFGCSGPGFSIHDTEVDGMSAAYPGGNARYWVLVSPKDAVIGGAGFAPLAGSCASDKTCELRKMYVLPEGRGLGAGRALLDLCMREARTAGFGTMYLETFHTMDAARRLYLAAGFREIEGSRGCTGHGGCDRFFERPL